MNTRKILVLCAMLLANALYASDRVPVRELFERADRYAGKKVTVTGEAIGDVMRDGELFWLNIKDGDFFIGAVIDRSQKEKIKNTGRYGVQGDIVNISGIYNLHCKQHWGERDIHADTLEIAQEGRVLEESIELTEVILSIILALAAIVFVFHYHRKNVRRDNGGLQS